MEIVSSEENWQKLLRELEPKHHAFSWKWRDVIHRSFGHKPYYLMSDKALVPLFFVSNPLFGKALISVPYLNAGGVLAKDEDSYNDACAFIEKLAKELDVAYVELREFDAAIAEGWENRSHKVSMLLELADNEELQFKAFPSKLRSQIRRPGKEGVETRIVGAVSDFYKVFSENMRDLGTPVYPKHFITNIFESFGPDCKFCVSYIGEKPIAAGFTINFDGYVEIPLASSLRSHNKLSANMQMYWEVIRQSCISGGTYFDFGRSSPDGGTFKFKKQWGAKPKELHWKYFVRKGEVPDVNPNSGKFALAVKCWQKLPLPVANFFGPHITKMLP